MSLKTDKTVPGREERVGACIAYGGTACGIGKAGKLCLKVQERGFSQAGICQLLPTLGMLLTLPETAVIVHGAIGCGSTGFPMNISIRLHHLLRGDPNAKDSLWFSTNLTETDVVHGGEQKLERSILEVDQRYHPKSIVVLQSCTPAIIGDDFEGVIERVRNLTKTPILASSCAGFKTKVWATGYDVAFHAIVHGYIEKDPEGRPLPRATESKRERPLVNIINLASVGRPDEDEMRRLLNAIGIDALIGPNFGSRESVRAMTQADLTVSVCPTHDDYFVDYLREEYGIPSVIKEMPIGLDNTERWLVDIASHFGLQERARTLAREESARARQLASRHIQQLKGKRVFLSAGEFRALVTASLFQELGLEVIGLRSYHHDDFGTDLYARLVQSQGGKDFSIDIANFQPFELVNLLEKLKPDLFAGHIWDNVWAARAGFPTITIFRIFDYYVGYRGFYEVAKKAARILRNSSFNAKLAQHVERGYHPEWYAESAFKYIKVRPSNEVETAAE